MKIIEGGLTQDDIDLANQCYFKYVGPILTNRKECKDVDEFFGTKVLVDSKIKDICKDKDLQKKVI